jgi:hypothetical protein
MNILVFFLALMSATGTMTQSDTVLISGKVSNFEESFPLEGVSVLVKGTKNSTGTQADGTFSLSVSTDNKVLVISLAGYETQEVKITTETYYDIILKRDDKQLTSNPTNKKP